MSIARHPSSDAKCVTTTPTPTRTMGKGSDWERKLSRHLDEHGWAVMRAGGSGGGTDHDRPDLVAGNGEFGWVIEHKYSSSRNIYVDPAEVAQIDALAEGWGMEGVVVLRWSTRAVDAADNADWYPVAPEFAGRTESGKYSFNVEEIQDRFPPLDEYL